MPHVNGGSDGDDLGDADEIKVFKHDEECEEEKKLIAEERQSDSLTEDKSSLVTEGESQVLYRTALSSSTTLLLFPSTIMTPSITLRCLAGHSIRVICMEENGQVVGG